MGDANAVKMFAYPDSKCVYGYACVCDTCVRVLQIPPYIDLKNPISQPPALGKVQPCEMCGRPFILSVPAALIPGYRQQS